MKKLILLMLLAGNLYSQSDSVPKVTAEEYYKFKRETKKNMDNIQLNLERCHKVYSTGIGLQVAGIAFTGGGIVAIGNSSAPEGGLLLMGVGSILSVAGIITCWVSHKYIGRAGEKLTLKQ